jgi:hypothetical protein
MDTYTEKYGNKAVRKNLTIPAWLNTFAEGKRINFSQVLQDSLIAIYERENAAAGNAQGIGGARRPERVCAVRP